MTKRLFAILLATIIAVGCLTGCGGTKEEAASSENKKIVVGATPVPHADILEKVVKDVLAKDGYELETVVFQDYVLPNTSLEEGELDANYFQTLGYMDQQNDEAGLHLKAAIGVHIEPMGIYSEKYAALADIPDGASIGIPNDPDNGERGLDLLIQKGLLTSKGQYGKDDNYTFESISKDKEANPHGYVITPLEAANLPLSLPDFDDETTVKRTNFLVVKEGNEDSEKTKALVKAISSDEVQKFIEDTYKGAVITSVIDPQ
ncbi:MAG: MetQ/NlpA family ABC transporter substrate-binding protein [Lachnospiraceae bacterium]|nr:MetQ/NlpA family ABC transporter substrate-binding protein [Lachnospiraceae bacterium]